MSRRKRSCGISKTEKAAVPISKLGTQRGAPFRTRPGVSLRDLLAVTKALADEQRVRALLALERGELCVCQIVELLGLATSTVSKHMSILKQARLVESRKDGRWIYYRLAGDEAPEVVRQAMDWTAGSLASDPQVQRDRQRLAAICTSDPHELCVAQGSAKRACT